MNNNLIITMADLWTDDATEHIHTDWCKIEGDVIFNPDIGTCNYNPFDLRLDPEKCDRIIAEIAKRFKEKYVGEYEIISEHVNNNFHLIKLLFISDEEKILFMLRYF